MLDVVVCGCTRNCPSWEKNTVSCPSTVVSFLILPWRGDVLPDCVSTIPFVVMVHVLLTTTLFIFNTWLFFTYEVDVLCVTHVYCMYEHSMQNNIHTYYVHVSLF